MSTYEVEFTYHVVVEGTKEDAQALVERMDEVFFDALCINCGAPECCPDPPKFSYVPGAMGSSTIKEAAHED